MRLIKVLKISSIAWVGVLFILFVTGIDSHQVIIAQGAVFAVFFLLIVYIRRKQKDYFNSGRGTKSRRGPHTGGAKPGEIVVSV